MLKLENSLTLDREAILSPNLCDRFSDDDLRLLGSWCYNGYKADEASRHRWMQRNEAGMDLALQIQKDKTFPWPNCSNVAFPLVTIAALQFHARAYPAIVNGKDLVKCEVFAGDDDPEAEIRADRIARHMSWQLLYEDKDWEEQMDKALLNVSIVGTVFKKTYHDPARGHNVSEMVLAKNLVLDYWAKSVEHCPRKTELVPMGRNDIYSGIKMGIYRDVSGQSWYMNPAMQQTSQARTAQDNRQGLTPPASDETSSWVIHEQHVSVDLDQDGYAEPYIITYESTTQTVLRIVSRVEDERQIQRTPAGEIIRIVADEYYSKIPFIPSPDGGIYDMGFGVFLGPLNEAVNSLVNMLLDCGTLQTTGGGFLGRGAKIRGGAYTFAPFEWKRVDSTGDDLRKSIFPLPVNAPSDVLFQLLSLLINYTSRVSGTTDIMVGENPGQNTPAETSRTMVEMGQKIYSAIFKRVWRATKTEFQRLYHLNSIFLALDKKHPYGVTIDDYKGRLETISPVADPDITSDTLRIQQASAVRAASLEVPGYNRDLVEKRFLRALRVDAVDQIYTGTANLPPTEDPKVALQKLKEEAATQRLMLELQSRQQEFAATLLEEQRLNNAKIVELFARAQQAGANAQSEEAYAQVALINAEISATTARNQHISKLLETALRAQEVKAKTNDNAE